MNPKVEQYHAVIAVADHDKSVAFYSTKLGFVHAFSWGEPASIAGVNLDRTQIFLETGTRQARKPVRCTTSSITRTRYSSGIATTA